MDANAWQVQQLAEPIASNLISFLRTHRANDQAFLFSAFKLARVAFFVGSSVADNRPPCARDQRGPGPATIARFARAGRGGLPERARVARFAAAAGNALFTEFKQLAASDGVAVDQFGSAAALSGDTVIVGALRKNGNSGVAYIFARNQGGANNWGEVKKLTAGFPAPDDQFGYAVAISADTVALGLNGSDAARGAVAIHERNQDGADNWGLVTRLSASDAEVNDRFGTSLALSRDMLVVGTPFKNSFTGAAYLFARNQGGADNWGQVQKLTANDAVAHEAFGFVVGISVDAVVAGAPGLSPDRPGKLGWTNGGSPATGAGAAYVFRRNQGGADNWGQAQKLTASDGTANDRFGAAVALVAGTLVAGADTKNNETGAVYFFGASCARRFSQSRFRWRRQNRLLGLARQRRQLVCA